MTNDASESPLRVKRRWYQFSLRTLLLFVTLCALPCGWLGVKIQPAKRRHNIVMTIKSTGGRVRYDYETPPWQARPGPYKPDEPKGPAWLRNILTDDFFNDVVSVDWSPKNRQDIDCLRDLTTLEDLSLDDSAASDAELQWIGRMKNLRALRLRNTQITDAGIDYLVGLTHPEVLPINGTKVTDAGVEKLQRSLPKCRIILRDE